MVGLSLLVCIFLMTFELGQTSVIGETENKAHILKLSKMMVKLESAVKDIQNDNRKLQNDNRQLKEVIAELSNRLENEIRLREQLEKRVRICEIYQREDDGNDVTLPQSSRNTTAKGKRISGKDYSKYYPNYLVSKRTTLELYFKPLKLLDKPIFPHKEFFC